MKKYLFLLTAAAILSGCEHPEKLCAVYQGTLPAADAPALKLQSRSNRICSLSKNPYILIKKTEHFSTGEHTASTAA